MKQDEQSGAFDAQMGGQDVTSMNEVDVPMSAHTSDNQGSYTKSKFDMYGAHHLKKSFQIASRPPIG